MVQYCAGSTKKPREDFADDDNDDNGDDADVCATEGRGVFSGKGYTAAPSLQQ